MTWVWCYLAVASIFPFLYFYGLAWVLQKPTSEVLHESLEFPLVVILPLVLLILSLFWFLAVLCGIIIWIYKRVRNDS